MKWSLDARIARATKLSETYPAARELLTFYRELALFQKPLFQAFATNRETDVRSLLRYFPDLIELVSRAGPAAIAERATTRLRDPAGWEELLQASWQGEGAGGLAADPTGRFFARVLLQPYAEYLASRGDTQGEPESRTCPFCNAWPVAGVLRGEGDGAKRWLLCSVCSTEWPFRRVLCWSCGEENKDQLPIYTAAQFEAVRVEACDTCHTYLKSVDLTKDGHAVPVVDEIATVALNIWAEEHGYTKLEANLLGM